MLSNNNEIVLKVDKVSKRFCRGLQKSLFYGIQDISSELIGLRTLSKNLRSEEFWALCDVDFELRQGESIGIIGKNGSGKTTLLRIISGLIRPDVGRVYIKGRVAPLIALGAGFNPILTGRENIYVNMSILGLSKQEIDNRFEDVINFAEIGDAIEAPLQTYSSGMAARLGFACAIHTDPDILLVDEVLSVGDIQFRAKCERKLAKLIENGTSIVLVSHVSQLIVSVCNRCLYLSQGKVVMMGEPQEVMDSYQSNLFSTETNQNYLADVINLPEKPSYSSEGADIISFCLKDEHKNTQRTLISGETAYFCIRCKITKPLENLGIYLSVFQLAEGVSLAFHVNSHADGHIFQPSLGDCEIQVQFPYVVLRPGLYSMNIYVKEGNVFVMDAYEAFQFTVAISDRSNQGTLYQPRSWAISD